MPKTSHRHRIGRVTIVKLEKYPYWHCRCTTPLGRYEKSMNVTTLEQAVKKAEQINILLERGRFQELDDLRPQKKWTFNNMADEFREKYARWSETTWKKCGGFLKILQAEFGPTLLEQLTVRRVQGYLTRRLDGGEITVATYNRYVSLIRRVFAMAVEWGHLADDPMIKLKQLPEKNKIPEALEEDQIEKLLEHLPPHAVPIVQLAVNTGLRRSELFRLTWADIKFDQREIIVRDPKNKEFRVIPLIEPAREVLEALKAELPTRKIRDLRVLPFADIKKSLDRAGRDAGIGHVHLHMLRHTFATRRLRDRGVPLDRIMELLGHKSMAMVLRYAKARPQQLQEAMATLEG